MPEEYSSDKHIGSTFFPPLQRLLSTFTSAIRLGEQLRHVSFAHGIVSK